MATGILLGVLCTLALQVLLAMLVGAAKGTKRAGYQPTSGASLGAPPRGGTGAVEAMPLSVVFTADTSEIEAALARIEALADRARAAIEKLNVAAAEAEAMDATKH